MDSVIDAAPAGSAGGSLSPEEERLTMRQVAWRIVPFLMLTYWFPKECRGRIVAVFMVSIPVSGFLGPPISEALLGTDGWLGFHGWRWLFVLEASPAVLLGLAAFAALPDGPAGARWLAPHRRAWLARRLEDDRASSQGTAPKLSVWRVMTTATCWRPP